MQFIKYKRIKQKKPANLGKKKHISSAFEKKGRKKITTKVARKQNNRSA